MQGAGYIVLQLRSRLFRVCDMEFRALDLASRALNPKTPNPKFRGLHLDSGGFRG